MILKKIKKFIDENIAIIMIGNWIIIYLVVLTATALALLGILSEHGFKMVLIVAAAPMYVTFLFDVILTIFYDIKEIKKNEKIK